MKSNFFRFSVSALALGVSLNANAFSISDHEAVTRMAFNELRQCGMVPASVPSTFDEDTVSANVDQDLDFIDKWLTYSHYYNPLKKLDMRREDSSVSVAEAEQALLDRASGASDLTAAFGRAIHHIQDAAVPPHVVPVDHWLTDGFEKYDVAVPTYSDRSKLCAVLSKLAAPTDLFNVLRGTALATLASIEGPVAGTKVNWRVGFWTPSNDASFGSYGAFGNEFGSTRIDSDDGVIEIDASVYTSYKAARLRAAVEATETAWLWFTRHVTLP